MNDDPLDSWPLTDCCGSFVTGVAWREGVLGRSEVMRWARSPDLWRRRLALVSTVPLNCPARGACAGGDPAGTLAVCRVLVDDREDMVVKAMSWALRELTKWDAAGVRVFLATHKGRVVARVVREVTNKLRTGLKNPRPPAAGHRRREQGNKPHSSLR